MTPELRDALELLRDHSGSDAFRALVDDVLAGRRDLLDASAAPEFAEVVFSQLARDFADNREQLAEHLAGDYSADGPIGACGSPCAGCTQVCGDVLRDVTDH